MSPFRRVLVAAIVAVVLGQSGAAMADTVTRRDAVGDVWRSLIGSSTYLPAPTQVEGDITSTRVAHGPHVIWISFRLRDLTTTSNGNFHRIQVLSNRRYRAIEIDAFPGHWTGTAVVTNAAGLVVGCPVRHRIDYDANRVILRLPRSCLGKPRRVHWVRVAVRSTVAGSTYAFADDARATGYVAALAYGPKVRR